MLGAGEGAYWTVFSVFRVDWDGLFLDWSFMSVVVVESLSRAQLFETP